ncbi:hypothetical protein MPSEU_000584000 [Mayamaea pseudoterrestris]|nr:hypothetical protein MPSEU_000584000 [Mayamaea pseudoterrestris]
MTSPAPVPIPSSSSSTPGVAGRTNYSDWDKKTKTLVEQVEQETKEELIASQQALGLDGNKYSRSEAEAAEKQKLANVLKVKTQLEKYKQRETESVQEFKSLLGPVVADNDADEYKTKRLVACQEEKSTDSTTIRITRDQLDAGKRVVSITDTSGHSLRDQIILTQDLSNLESKMMVNAQAKSFPGSDAENAVPEEPRERRIYGIIKCFISNVHNCTILIKCKIISGTLEMHNCSNVHLVVQNEATVATIQVDLSRNLQIDFRDAPSGKNPGTPGQPKIYWGEDKDDRIFHAGVKRMKVRIYRDDFMESEIDCDYMNDGAKSIGNATPEEFQFITSVHSGKLVTEEVVRAGNTTGKNVRAMTPREVEEENKRRERAAELAINMAEDMIQIRDKHGNVLAKKVEQENTVSETDDDDDAVDEEIYTMSKEQIKLVVDECDHNKIRGNEAFGAGEYAQAILLYSLALDKADELPDVKLYPRDVLYSNRAACFLKLGQHEKAEEDARKALDVNPDNIKAIFRHGLALHAMGKYLAALPVLAKAHKLEPHNKQVKQALQFCEVRMEQERRKVMES